MYDLHPHKYEMLVAELLRDMGYDVFPTTQTVDGGRDIIAAFRTPTGENLHTLVECKRNRRDRPVDINVIKQFLFTLRDQDKANVGLIVTTSFFSEPARLLQNNYKRLLNLYDYQ